MLNRFHFKNFNPEDEVKSSANLTLSRILDLAPYGSTAVALLEKQDQEFRCSLDIYSVQGPFIASTVRPTALEAVAAAEGRIRTQIDLTRKHFNPAFS